MQMIRCKNLLLAFTLVLSLSVSAQFQAVERADQAFNNLQYSKAIELYLEVIKTGKFPETAIHNIAESYRQIRDVKNAEIWYAQSTQLRSRTPKEVWNYAMVLKSREKYAEANNWIRLYHDMVPKDSRALRHLAAGDYVKELNPTIEDYILSGLTINTEGSDFGAAYFKDDLVVFSSNYQNGGAVKRSNNISGGQYTDLYVSKAAAGGALSTPQDLSKRINSKFNEGPVCFTNDNLQIYFTRNAKVKGAKSGLLNLKVYRATLAGSDFVNLEALPFNSDEYSVAHPSLSKDGSRLFFASDMPGGFGGFDIYMVPIDKGFFGEPVNLGPIINTEGDEVFPFIHESGWLFFASDGFVGIGGLDVYKSQYKYKAWSQPENIKAPLNSPMDDFTYVADSAMTTGYIASNRAGGVGEDDIYTWKYEKVESSYSLQVNVIDENDFRLEGLTVYLNDEKGNTLTNGVTDRDGIVEFEVDRLKGYVVATSSPSFTNEEKEISVFPSGDTRVVDVKLSKKNFSVEGVVIEAGVNQVLEGVLVSLTKSSSQLPLTASTKKDGKFQLLVDANSNYEIRVSKPGYLAITRIVSTQDARPGLPIQVDNLYLNRLVVGQVMEIENIYFSTGSADINTASSIELDKVVKFMAENPVDIEVAAHTDVRGDYGKNMDLSQKRAESVMAYLTSKGIDRSRMRAKGYGESEPKNKCKEGVKCSDAEHGVNRRVEMRITKVG